MTLSTFTRDLLFCGAGIAALMIVMQMAPRLDQSGSWRDTAPEAAAAAEISSGRGLRDAAVLQETAMTDTLALGRGRN